jgi:hypothetical protein
MIEQQKSVKVSAVAACVMLSACGGSDESPAPPPVQQALVCDDSLKSAFRPDANTEVLAVQQFKAGDDYPNATLENRLVASVPTKFGADLCLVTLKVGPGNPGLAVKSQEVVS